MDLAAAWGTVTLQPSPAEKLALKRGPKPYFAEAFTGYQRIKRWRDKERQERLERIAILDMETDPFDNKNPLQKIKPFLAVLYSDDFDPVIIWEENENDFVSAVIRAIENLPGRYTIYAHNGGKFDYLFLLHRLRGFVSFKGRGLMSARVGRHELRDSFHIIPERLANIQKDAISYDKMRRNVRNKFRDEIIRYCISDCVYLLDVVKKFVREFGLKLSIGQAAIAELKKHYKVSRVGEQTDAFLRNYFFGGRVECLCGRGIFASNDAAKPPFKLFDVNSMYPFVMAHYQHPTGNQFTVRRGLPGVQTVFLELTCRNFGGLVKRTDDGEVTADYDYGTFRTTIWEYQTALRHGLIEAVKINWCIDFPERTDFSQFVLPLYERRQQTKLALKAITPGSAAYYDLKKDDMFYKLILNNAYGKFAQNPRRFKDNYISEPGELPALDDCSSAVKQIASVMPDNANAAIMKEWGIIPEFKHDRYWIWSRPQSHLRFNNVATAASITGAARSVLLDAIASADDPIYCDTDSLICRQLRGALHNENLGAWKIEHEIDECIIAGKKLYAYKIAGIADGQPGRVKVRSKGVQDVTWADLERLLKDEIVSFINPAPTFTKMSTQHYMERNVRATVAAQSSRIVNRKRLAA